jgi:kanamycin kinase
LLAEENYRTGNYDKSAYPDRFGYRSAEEAYRVLTFGKDELKNDTLIHGDYCLPNIILDGWKFSGFIDLGNAGVGDRHIDLFWGSWTLWFNLKTDSYRDRFLDSYGRDKVDEDILRVVAAAEVFG